MKTKLALLTALAFTITGMSLPAKADSDDWFKKWDHNRDGRWSWNEFRKAHYDWWRAHHDERRLNDHELHEMYRKFDRDHDGYVCPDDVRGFHHW